MKRFLLFMAFVCFAVFIGLEGARELVTPEIELTECYDKYGNEIIGVECEEEVYPYGLGFLFSFRYLIFVLAVIFIVGEVTAGALK